MQAQLIFNLPEDNNEFTLMNNASKWYNLAWELDQHLRAQTKYAPDTMHDEYYKALKDTRNKLYEMLNEEGLAFDL
jgi:hypothetical protein